MKYILYTLPLMVMGCAALESAGEVVASGEADPLVAGAAEIAAASGTSPGTVAAWMAGYALLREAVGVILKVVKKKKDDGEPAS